MNIHDDKTLYKLIAGIVLLFVAPILLVSVLVGGLKSFFFVLWLFFGLTVFGAIVAFTLDTSLSTSSSNVLVRVISAVADYHLYRLGMIVFLLVFLVLSIGVWEYLDKKYPANNGNVAAPSVFPAMVEKND